MNKNIRVVALSLLGAAIALSACSRQQEEVFDQPASQRVLEGINKVDQVLTEASIGWGTTYKTGRGFTTDLQFKFLPDQRVSVWSDFWPEPIVSTYKYSASRGVVLTFDTYGMMSKLADPTILYDGTGSPADRQKKLGQSFGGDIEFEILSATPDSVVMRGMKQMNSRVVLKPLTSAPSSDGVSETISALQDFVSYLRDGSGYRYKTVELDGKRVGEFYFRGPKGDLISATYDSAALVMVDPDGTETVYEVTRTEKGFQTATPVKIGDKEYSSFEREDSLSPFHAVGAPSVVLNINSNYPVVVKTLPNLDQWLWGGSDWIWGPAVDHIIGAANNYFGVGLKEVGLGRYDDGVRTLYLWPNPNSKRFDIECHMTQVEGNIYRLDLTDWQLNNLPEGVLVEGSGLHELVKYFTTYFDETTFVSFVPWSNGRGVTMYSGLDSHYLLDLQADN